MCVSLKRLINISTVNQLKTLIAKKFWEINRNSFHMTLMF